MPAIAPLLAEMGLNAALVSAAVLSARVALFAVRFMRSAGIGPWRSK